ncbi:MAG TPA: hypothetical protein VK158_04730 [Acidobacteriota bacterium]|nr:hypothetical protein [Acidobacteriota bacterium]
MNYIKNMYESEGFDALPTEFPNVEFEAKLTPTIPQQLEMSTRDLAEIIYGQRAAKYLEGELSDEKRSQESYFVKGTNTATFAQRENGFSLKQKKNLPNRNPFCAYVLKRSEKIQPVSSLDEVFTQSQSLASEGYRYVGDMDKVVASLTFLDRDDGRVYDVSVSTCNPTGSDRYLRQVEIEYHGFIPGFYAYPRTFKYGDEAQVVAGVHRLADIIRNHNDMKFTRMTKQDFSKLAYRAQ